MMRKNCHSNKKICVRYNTATLQIYDELKAYISNNICAPANEGKQATQSIRLSPVGVMDVERFQGQCHCKN